MERPEIMVQIQASVEDRRRQAVVQGQGGGARQSEGQGARLVAQCTPGDK